eukprot:1846209-Rhodomonas_salina.1
MRERNPRERVAEAGCEVMLQAVKLLGQCHAAQVPASDLPIRLLGHAHSLRSGHELRCEPSRRAEVDRVKLCSITGLQVGGHQVGGQSDCSFQLADGELLLAARQLALPKFHARTLDLELFAGKVKLQRRRG